MQEFGPIQKAQCIAKLGSWPVTNWLAQSFPLT